MSGRMKLAFLVLGLAAAAGVLADNLLRVTPWGINLILWLAPLIVGVALLTRAPDSGPSSYGKWLLVPLLFFAGAYAWRDSFALRAMDAVAMMMLASLIVVLSRHGRFPFDGAVGACRAAAVSLGSTLFGFFPLVGSDIVWKDLPRGPWTRRAVPVARGALIAIPLLLLFGALFASADEVFRNLFSRVFDVNPDRVSQHLVFTSVATWLVGGFLRGMFLAVEQVEPPESSVTEKPLRPRLGITEITVAVGSLVVLFGLFVGIQIRYLFGGDAHVQITPHLTYAQYAQKGFFELVAVAVLVLPVLLTADYLLSDRDTRSLRLFRVLAGIQTLLVFVVIASAGQRMQIYQVAYGLTELRFYIMAFIGWLATVFVWFGATVLTGRRSRFAVGGMATALTMLALLHVINPDARIVNANVTRAHAGRHFDIGYVADLSADAVPSLVAALPDLNSDQRDALLQLMDNRWAHSDMDWRTLNWSRFHARNAARRAVAAMPRMVARKPSADPSSGLQASPVRVQ